MTWALLKLKGQIFCCSGNRFCNFHTYLHALPSFCHHSSSTEGQTTAEHRLPLAAKLLVSMLLLKELLPYKENQLPAERKKENEVSHKINSSYKRLSAPEFSLTDCILFKSAWSCCSFPSHATMQILFQMQISHWCARSSTPSINRADGERKKTKQNKNLSFSVSFSV